MPKGIGTLQAKSSRHRNRIHGFRARSTSVLRSRKQKGRNRLVTVG